MTTDKLAGKVAIVTGAACGFGRVLVRALLDAGANVAALDIDERGLIALGDTNKHYESRILAQAIDIADSAA